MIRVIHWLRRRLRNPGTVVVGWFAITIAIGTVMLSQPLAQNPDAGPVSIGDAAFTAASAVTVTGLVVVDTAQTWSLWGELVILALIQLGGLGILTMAAFFGIVLSRRLGVRWGLLAGAEIGLSELGVLRSMIGRIVRFVILSEVVVSVALTGGFVYEGSSSFAHAVHLGVFHSVSAFNNAGFSILEGGLEPYVANWYINIVIVGAFVVGGIGFPVVFELLRRWRSPRTWSLHTKVTLVTTLVLLAGGTLLIGLAEWNNPSTLEPLSGPDKVLAAGFQSATARTAGFNTVPMSGLRPASLVTMITLMIIGTGAASTGGGIKVSTVLVVFRSWLAEMRGDTDVAVFERRIPSQLQRQALALVAAAIGVVGGGTLVLSVLHNDIPLSDLLFETASAFGTAGLSTGVTSDLGGLGQIVVIGLMFIGRVGPITFGTAVLLRHSRRQYQFAQEGLLVG